MKKRSNWRLYASVAVTTYVIATFVYMIVFSIIFRINNPDMSEIEMFLMELKTFWPLIVLILVAANLQWRLHTKRKD